MGVFAMEVDLTSGEFAGEVVSLGAGVGFDPWKNLGFRAGIEYCHLNLDVTDDDW